MIILLLQMCQNDGWIIIEIEWFHWISTNLRSEPAHWPLYSRIFNENKQKLIGKENDNNNNYNRTIKCGAHKAIFLSDKTFKRRGRTLNCPLPLSHVSAFMLIFVWYWLDENDSRWKNKTKT